MKHALLILLFLGLFFSSVAQPETTGFDSIAVTKVKGIGERYKLETPKVSEIQLKWKSPRRGSHKIGSMAGDAARNLFTSMVGKTINTAQEMEWQITHELNTNAYSLNWKVELFCKGELEKESERVRNSDGSKSIETKKTAHLFWNKGATGYVMERGDSIIQFAVSLNPMNDTSSVEEASAICVYTITNEIVNRWNYGRGVDYILKGQFRGRELKMFFNSNVNRSWMFLENKLVAMFKMGSEINNNGHSNKKTARLFDYLLFNKNENLTDCLRLAMMSRLVQESVSRSTWERDLF